MPSQDGPLPIDPSFPGKKQRAVAPSATAALLRLLAEATIRPAIPARLPLAQAACAHTLREGG